MISTIHPIPAFYDNYIWALSEADGNSCCVVDPGDAQPVIAYLEQNGLSLSDVFITHHHPDHTGGLLELIERFQPRVFGPRPSNIQGINHYLGEGDQLELFGQQFSVFEVPGHTLDHIAYYCAESEPPLLFCGDTLFAAGCGRLFEGTPEMMVNSLAKLAALQPDTRVFCTHEYTMANLKFAATADPDNQDLKLRIESEQAKRDRDVPTLPSEIGLELLTNPFLRCDKQTLIQSAASRLGRPAANATEVFATLRGWKDNF